MLPLIPCLGLIHIVDCPEKNPSRHRLGTVEPLREVLSRDGDSGTEPVKAARDELGVLERRLLDRNSVGHAAFLMKTGGMVSKSDDIARVPCCRSAVMTRRGIGGAATTE